MKKHWTGAIDEIRLAVMVILATNLLPDDVEALKTIVEQEPSQRLTAQEEIERLRPQLRLLLSQRFAAKSERVEGDSPQLGLFDEVEVEAQIATDDDAAVITTVAGHTRARGHRRPLPAHLLREEISMTWSRPTSSARQGSVT